MEELTQPYHEVRALLADLVASWPWDRPGMAFEKAKVYLDFHCADCGAKLSAHTFHRASGADQRCANASIRSFVLSWRNRAPRGRRPAC